MLRKKSTLVVLVVAVALVAAACSSDDGTIEGPTIKVGSANFSESALVAEIYAQALEAEGYSVDRKLNIGSREIYKPALESGELDLIPEYIGTMLAVPVTEKVGMWFPQENRWLDNDTPLTEYPTLQGAVRCLHNCRCKDDSCDFHYHQH